jgi:hypothetical protein
VPAPGRLYLYKLNINYHFSLSKGGEKISKKFEKKEKCGMKKKDNFGD